MRDLFVVGIFVIGAIATMKRPYYGALLWVWVSVMNPHRLSYGFAYSLPLAQISVIVTVLAMAARSKEVRWPGGAPLVFLGIFVGWMAVTTMGAILLDLSFIRYVDLLKTVFMVYVIATIVRSRSEIVGFVWVIVMSIGFYGIKGGAFTLASGGSYRVWGPPDSVVEGNNELAVALVMIVPLAFFLAQNLQADLPRFLSRAPWTGRIKTGLNIAMFLCAVGAIGSQSRGALLAISVMTTALWLGSSKKVGLTIVLLIAVPSILAFMPESWYARMDTIQTYESDDSAMGRINAWTMALNVAKDRITGAGFATASPIIYDRYAPNPSIVIVAHSVYFQVLGEHGFIGLALYLMMWSSTFVTTNLVVKSASKQSELKWAADLARMLRVSLLGFAVGGAFLSLAYWDMPYYLMVVIVALAANIRDASTAIKSGKQIAQDI